MEATAIPTRPKGPSPWNGELGGLRACREKYVRNGTQGGHE
jgi:hypothetical protein